MENGNMASGTSTNSSDFVRKLYKMLEDPSHRDIVRWSENGDSFVVVEDTEFTKRVLPQHFKHNNFASFVRQLNKYDFHKVKKSEENGDQGENVWIFAHDNFSRNRRDQLDNIKRKPPAPKKSNNPDSTVQLQQLDDIGTQLKLLQDSQASLRQQLHRLAVNHDHVTRESLQMAECNRQTDQAVNVVLEHLEAADLAMRNQNLVGWSGQKTAQDLSWARQTLQAATKSKERIFVKLRELERHGSQIRNAINYVALESSPSSEAQPAEFGFPTANGSPNGLRAVSTSAGRAAFKREEDVPEKQGDLSSSAAAEDDKQFATTKWKFKPKILVVEDDAVCRRVVSKFVRLLNGEVETAEDGVKGLKMLRETKYDLVLMDIILPQLSGVDVTKHIRQQDETTPIVAMTSDISQEDRVSYYRSGLNDILAKPFTKKRLHECMEKHLYHLIDASQRRTSYVPVIQNFGAPVSGLMGPMEDVGSYQSEEITNHSLDSTISPLPSRGIPQDNQVHAGDYPQDGNIIPHEEYAMMNNYMSSGVPGPSMDFHPSIPVHFGMNKRAIGDQEEVLYDDLPQPSEKRLRLSGPPGLSHGYVGR